MHIQKKCYLITILLLASLVMCKTAWSQSANKPTEIRDCPTNTNVEWNDCWGTYRWSNGNFYTGGFKNNQFDGIANFFWADGSFYVGHFRKGKFHGLGVMTYSDKSWVKGMWENDKLVHEISGSKSAKDSSAAQATAGTANSFEEQWNKLNQEEELKKQKLDDFGRAVEKDVAARKKECSDLKSRGLTEQRRTQISQRLGVPRSSIVVIDYFWDAIFCELRVDTSKGVLRYSF